jgi:general secretion pathway protein D
VNPFNPRYRRQPSRGVSSPVWRLISAACVASLASCASYEHMKGNVQLKLDQTNEGVESLRKATRHAPTDAEYKIDYLRKRDQSVQDLLAAAESLRDQGKLADSKAAFERVLEMDQGNARAAAGLAKLAQQARHAKLLADGESQLTNGKFDLALDRAQQVLAVDAQDFRAKKLKVAAMETLSSLELERSRASAAKTLLEKPVTLQFNDAPLRTVFESLSKSVGLNVLLDRDVKNNARVSIFVKDIAVADAIDFILMQNQLERRLINSNTLLVYPSTDGKKAEYEDLTIRSFQITNADIKYLSNLLKTMLKLREVAADERSGVLVIRDTAEKLNLAAKLIAAHDVADPEIMLEVEVLEVSSTRNSNLGLLPPNSITFATPVPQGGLTWGALKALRGNDLLVTPLAATFNFKLEDIDAKLLASPRIRARNREKARIMIGDRVPTITNTVTPLTTGSSVVTGTVTYLDVGLRLEVESQVYADNEVGIKLALEVSNIVAEFTDPQGGRSYQIGTRNANTNLRLKDGETQILGGLITDQDRNTASKIPGLGHLPIVGRLFGNNNGNSVNSEIILSITPRIVRNLPDRPPEIRSIFSGTLNGMREKPILAEPLRQLKFTPPAANAAGTGTTPPQNAEVPTPGQTAGGTTPVLFNAAPSTEQFAAPAGGGLLPAPPPMIPRPPASR